MPEPLNSILNPFESVAQGSQYRRMSISSVYQTSDFSETVYGLCHLTVKPLRGDYLTENNGIFHFYDHLELLLRVQETGTPQNEKQKKSQTLKSGCSDVDEGRYFSHRSCATWTELSRENMIFKKQRASRALPGATRLFSLCSGLLI